MEKCKDIEVVKALKEKLERMGCPSDRIILANCSEIGMSVIVDLTPEEWDRLLGVR